GARAHAGPVRRGDRPARAALGGAGVTAAGYPLERWRQTIAEGWSGTRPLADAVLRGAVEGAVAALDQGDLRVASPPATPGGPWQTHAWLKQAILLYFRMHVSAPLTAGALEFFDKVPPKRNLEAAGIRVVPPGVARYGS